MAVMIKIVSVGQRVTQQQLKASLISSFCYNTPIWKEEV